MIKLESHQSLSSNKNTITCNCNQLVSILKLMQHEIIINLKKQLQNHSDVTLICV